MEKIFKQKNFNNFVWTPLGSIVNIYINFCLQVHFKVSAAWYCSHHVPPVSLTSAANLPPVSLTPMANLQTSISGTGGKICRRCRWYRRQFCHLCYWHRWQICQRWRWCTLICEYLHEFSKKFEMTLCYFQGLGGRWFMKKKPEAKNLVTLSLLGLFWSCRSISNV